MAEAQTRIVYYLMAIAASAIAFSVHQTSGLTMTLSMIPLGLAVICWGVSFWAGCRNRTWFSATLQANYALLQLQDGTHPNCPDYAEHRLAATEGVRDAANENNDAMGNMAKLQFRLLIIGGICFLVWHIVEMLP